MLTFIETPPPIPSPTATFICILVGSFIGLLAGGGGGMFIGFELMFMLTFMGLGFSPGMGKFIAGMTLGCQLGGGLNS